MICIQVASVKFEECALYDDTVLVKSIKAGDEEAAGYGAAKSTS